MIFTHSDEQAEVAQAVIADVASEFLAPVITDVLPAPEFFVAEDYHQDYYRHHPTQGYCSFVISPKIDKFRKKFANLTR